MLLRLVFLDHGPRSNFEIWVCVCVCVGGGVIPAIYNFKNIGGGGGERAPPAPLLRGPCKISYDFRFVYNFRSDYITVQ